ncbi:selenocysteine-specific translation elongation factor [Shewanella maritima]|uniref:Selenocysteine-specific elongation factor n=1 Tax=Shewanella maritima TaxID=2520507 RepID=A0A411PJI3_9GAMM|nr:selenocysteine-specific translation elongation factor [Shewanella maritima]QBF83695.1 selenocysteine-specific translation elongation factor [Shewanella maritima]
MTLQTDSHATHHSHGQANALTQAEQNSSLSSVVALAGHVDHGKTALIYAMTGIMTARKAEQECGMTQNLGFAHFKDAKDHQIGIIDVPGHERYIRNMVAGLWSIDLVLLVVAANEGWMPMTQAHLEVVNAMSHAKVLVCITKSDLVDKRRLSELEDECLQRVMDTCEQIPNVICVSAHSGDNINELKQLISDELNDDSIVSAAQEAGAESAAEQALSATGIQSCHLYVDRSFSISGIGTVVTGSLVGGELSVGDKLHLMPSNQVVKVRNLQAYNKSVEHVAGTSRVAVGIKGVNFKLIHRGDCLTNEPQVHQGTQEIILRLNKRTDKLRNCQLEVAIGSWNGIAQMIKITDTQLVRLKLKAPVTCYFGQSVALIQQGGSRLIAGGRIAWLTPIMRWQRRQLYHLLNQLPQEFSSPYQTKVQLQLNGVLEKQQFACVKGSDVVSDLKLIETDKHYLLTSLVEEAEQKILMLLAEPAAAITSAEFVSRLKLSPVTIDLVLQRLKAQEKVHLSFDTWVAEQGMSEDDLCPASQSLLAKVRDAERAGIAADKQLVGNDKKLIKNLARLKYVTLLDDHIYYDTQLYNQLVEDVLSGCEKLDLLSMAQIKDRSHLSRKYAIPLANRMERDGWVRRQENDRLVLKLVS